MVRKRRRHTAPFKFRAALEALEGSKTISQLPSGHVNHANPARARKQFLLQEGPRSSTSMRDRVKVRRPRPPS